MRNLLLIGVCGVVLAHGQVQAGKILGQVRDERLKPIAGARVDISLKPASGSRVKPFLAAMLTHADGTFQVSVTAGTYSVCASIPNGELLDSCLWNDPVLPSVRQGETVRLIPITLRRGYPVTVRIEDPGKVLADSKAPLDRRRVLVGVNLPNGMFLPAPRQDKNQTLLVHRVFVPRDSLVPLFVHAKGLSLDDEKGFAIDTDKPQRVNVKIAGEHSKRDFVFKGSKSNANFEDCTDALRAELGQIGYAGDNVFRGARPLAPRPHRAAGIHSDIR